MLNLIPHFILEHYQKSIFNGSFPAFSLFADISGFTKISDELMKKGNEGVEKLSFILQNTFKPAVKRIYESGGFITNFAGDGIAALFKIGQGQDEQKCVQIILSCAGLILNEIKERKSNITKFGGLQLNVKIGIAAGNIDWSIVGSDMQSFYFKGKGVELSAKCQNKAKKNEIIVDDSILSLIDSNQFIISKTANVFFKIKPLKISEAKSNEQDSAFSVAEITKEIFTKKFLPKSVLEFRGDGEFRNAASAFISFTGLKNRKELDNFFNLLIGAVELQSGYLKDISFGDKGGVAVCFFGAPVSYENDLERAVKMLLSLNEKILNEPPFAHLKYRAGLTYGKVYAGIIGGNEKCEYSLIGSAVNLASRLMSKAEWGEIWVSDSVKILLGNNYSFEQLKKQKLKGFAVPVTPYKLLKEKKSLHFLTAEKIIGRVEELDSMQTFIEDRIKKRDTGILYVKGEAGIGKTKIINELRQRINTNNITWFSCPSKEDLMQPFHPFSDLIKKYFNYSENNTLKINKINYNHRLKKLLNNFSKSKKIDDRVKKEIINELKRTFTVPASLINLTWKGSFYDKLDASLRIENILFSLYYFLKAVCSLQPLIIEFEDIQWLDDQTVDMINLLLRNLSGMPLILICTYRTPVNDKINLIDPHDTASLDVEIGPLKRENIQSLAEEILKTKINKDASSFFSDKTNGNPLFLSQLALDMKERGQIIRKNEKYELTMSEDFRVPATVNNVLISRFDRLSPEIKELVQIASVLGNEFNINLLSQLCGEGIGFKNKIKIAVESSILTKVRGENYSFKHALLRDALYDMQLRSGLRNIHLKISDIISRMIEKKTVTKHLEEYVYHFGVGNEIINEKYKIILNKKDTTDSQRKSIDIFLNSMKKLAEYYETNYVNNEAVNKTGIVLGIAKLVNDENIFINYSLKRGNILKILGRYDEALKDFNNALKIASQILEPALIAQSFLALGTIAERKGSYDSSISYFNDAMRIFKEIDDKTGIAKTYSHIGLYYFYKGEYDKAVVNYESSRDVSISINDKGELSKALGNIGTVSLRKGNPDEAMKYYKQKIKIDKVLKDSINLSKVMGNIGLVYIAKGNYTKAMKYLKEKVKLCVKLGDKREIILAYNNIGVIYSDTGKYKKALKIYHDTLKICKELGDKFTLSGILGNIGEAYKNSGKFTEALNYLDQAIKLTSELGNKQYLTKYLLNKSEILYLLSDKENAKTILLRGLRLARELKNSSMINTFETLRIKWGV